MKGKPKVSIIPRLLRAESFELRRLQWEVKHNRFAPGSYQLEQAQEKIKELQKKA